jgi:hypothetical protein
VARDIVGHWLPLVPDTEADMTFDLQEAQQLIITWARPVAIAAVILIVAHFAAKAVKWAIAKAVDRLPFVSRRDSAGPSGAKPTVDVGERIGEVGYWLVWLLGLIAALTQFGALAPVVAPLQSMLIGFANTLPNIVGAALIFLIGFALATVVRRMVEATVEAAELDRRLVDAGLTHTPRGPALARLLGILVFTLIIIPVAIAALDVLNIEAISRPATGVLETILSTIPGVIGAALVIFIAYLIGRWIMTLTEEGLKSIGFDAIIDSIANAEPMRLGREQMDPTPGVDTLNLSGFPPSRMIGLTVLVGIVLFASVEAARILGFGAMAAMLGNVLELATQVLFGLVIIALGVLLANILANAAGRGGKPTSEIASVLVRWGVIALATAVGLRFMGLANDIIVLAFGLILGSVAVAAAIAFGIGGREAAKRLLERWTKS